MKKWLLFVLAVTVLSGCRPNRAPGQPTVPDGLEAVLVDSLSTYTSLADDADGDPITYRFDWGDGDTSDWVESMESTFPGGASHAWRSAGTFVVRAQARDNHEVPSGWSAGLSVKVAFSWRRTFGGADFENAAAIQQDADGGYIVVGTTNSFGAGMNDVWLVKTDERGNKVWDKTFGGAADDAGYAASRTSDDGCIIAGYSRSYGTGNPEAWLIRTDSSGAKSWDLLFGDANYEYGAAVGRTLDGGFVIAINARRQNDPDYDIQLHRTDSSGNLKWGNTFGGQYDDEAAAVEQTADSGFIVAGTTNSSGVGVSDAWLIRTDSFSNRLWDKTFGGAGEEHAEAVRQTADGGYIFAGSTTSYGSGSSDFWLVKTQPDGTLQWSKTFGGADADYASSVQQTPDGGYIVAGYTYSFGAGDADIWLVKTAAGGNLVWDRTYGGPDSDYGGFVQLASDGGYIVGGNTRSFGAGMADFWLIKVNSEGD